MTFVFAGFGLQFDHSQRRALRGSPADLKSQSRTRTPERLKSEVAVAPEQVRERRSAENEWWIVRRSKFELQWSKSWHSSSNREFRCVRPSLINQPKNLAGKRHSLTARSRFRASHDRRCLLFSSGIVSWLKSPANAMPSSATPANATALGASLERTMKNRVFGFNIYSFSKINLLTIYQSLPGRRYMAARAQNLWIAP